MDPPSANPSHADNLPRSLSSFIGREREIEAVKRLLGANRLLTLVGAGGCGKTRLAIRAASELAGDFSDGVWMTEFASLGDGTLAPQAVQSTLGVKARPGSAVTAELARHLASRQALLLFDNCEHLVSNCAALAAALLEACPDVRILATSREPLGVSGEVVWAVPPLSVPDAHPWRSPLEEEIAFEAFARAEAVRLFASRARSIVPDFTLTRENGPWVASLCRRLDGIPLAIELAAARVRALSVRQIVERLDRRFQLLTSNLRTVPARHQTLEAALDWSYALLPAAEQAVLRQLSVFAQGWSLEAAEAVVEGETLDLLSNLVDKSLVEVLRAPENRRRYRLLETVRQYAGHKLRESGAWEAVMDRFLAFYVGWAEAASPHLTSAEQPEWMVRFDLEIDNIRAALDYSEGQPGQGANSLRLAAASGMYWRLRGFLTEGRTRLVAALARPGAQGNTSVRAWAEIRAANLAYLQTDFEATRTHAEAALAIGRALGDAGRTHVAWALELLGETATEIGNYEAAPGLFWQALEIFTELDEPREIGNIWMQLGWCAMRMGNYAEAEEYFNESLPRFRKLDEHFLTGIILAGLGELAIRQGRYERADQLLRESLEIRRDLKMQWGLAGSLGSLGWVALEQRDYDRMRTLLSESLAIRNEIGDQGGMAWCFEKLALGIVRETQPFPAPLRREAALRAVEACAKAAALRAPLNSVIDPADQPEFARLLAGLRRAVGEDAFAQAWREGETMPVETARARALAPPEHPALSEAQAARVKYGGLSPREQETARLIAQGKTNQEIAGAMVVRVKTVETYVTRILNKLGFDSRVQVAVWAAEVGLAGEDPQT